MMVVRLRRGWRIHLSDCEMRLMQAVADHGLADFADTDQGATLGIWERKALYSDRWQAIGGPLRHIDSDHGHKSD
jgi:hypothetical protein